jgi:hypothetical protein
MGRRLIFPLLAAAALLAACAVKPPAPEPEFASKYGNACLPEAASMAQSLRQHGITARVLGIYTPEWGHAVTTYLYPPGKNQLWAWDSTWKSLRLRAWADDATSTARAWLANTHPGTPLKRAEFLE